MLSILSPRCLGAVLFFCCGLGMGSAQAAAFDHQHKAWNSLLQEHVVVQRGGLASAVDYAGLAKDKLRLNAYTDSLSAVSAAQYQQWSKPQQLAFLINAYNAFTIELILRSYPGIGSIRDLGNLLFNSPWKKEFIPLLGSHISLDAIEHSMIRKQGAFDDPRIHAAVNCASVGCPALRNEAYVAERLDAQLSDSLSRFLSDTTRNRYNVKRGRLEVSRIFDWYGKDFEQGHKGYASLKDLFAQHAAQLSDNAAAQAAIRAGRYKLQFLDYDWSLNDVR